MFNKEFFLNHTKVLEFYTEFTVKAVNFYPHNLYGYLFSTSGQTIQTAYGMKAIKSLYGDKYDNFSIMYLLDSQIIADKIICKRLDTNKEFILDILGTNAINQRYYRSAPGKGMIFTKNDYESNLRNVPVVITVVGDGTGVKGGG